MSSRKIIKIIILFLLFFGIWSSYGYASQLWLIVKYADSGGWAWDLNQIWDNVNGRNICPSLNTNTNNVPWCDMSKNVWYNNNNTLNNASDDFYNWDLIVRTNDIFSFNAWRNWIKAWDGVDSVTITCNLPAAQSAIRPGYKRAFLPWS